MEEFEPHAPNEGDWVIRKGASEANGVAAIARQINLAPMASLL